MSSAPNVAERGPTRPVRENPYSTIPMSLKPLSDTGFLTHGGPRSASVGAGGSGQDGNFVSSPKSYRHPARPNRSKKTLTGKPTTE